MDSEDALLVLLVESRVMNCLVRPVAVLISQYFLLYDNCEDDRFSPGASNRVSPNCHGDLHPFGWYIGKIGGTLRLGLVLECLTGGAFSPWAHRGPHAPPPPHHDPHEWYQIVQWTLRNDLSDVVNLLNDRLTAPENH